MINAYQNEKIILIKSGGIDEWNEPLATTEIITRARVDYKTQKVKDISGDDMISSAVVLLKSKITYEDKIKIDGIEYPIIRIDRKQDFSNVYWEVYL